MHTKSSQMFVPLLVASRQAVTSKEKIVNDTKYSSAFGENHFNQFEIIGQKWRIALTPVVYKKDDI